MKLIFELTIEQTNACLAALDKQRTLLESIIQGISEQARAQVEQAKKEQSNG